MESQFFSLMQRICQTEFGSNGKMKITKIGKGTTAKVYLIRCRDHSLKDYKVVKLMKKHPGDERVNELNKIQKALNDIKFSNSLSKAVLLASGLYFSAIDSYVYSVYPYVQGRSLQEGKLSPSQLANLGQALGSLNSPIALEHYEKVRGEKKTSFIKFQERLGREMTDALDREVRKLRSYGIIHGDLNPGNILWNGDEPVLIDFDCADMKYSLEDIFAVCFYYIYREDNNDSRADLFTFLESYNRMNPLFLPDWSLAFEICVSKFAKRQTKKIGARLDKSNGLSVKHVAGIHTKILYPCKIKEKMISELEEVSLSLLRLSR